LPQQFRQIVKRASSGTDRSTRFNLNFDALPSFHLSSPLTSKNVSADFSASVSDAQRILWRDDLSVNVDTYELTTVSHDTAFAFLATRCLKHLAEQHAHQFTRGSACVLRDFYVDDLLTGADDTVDELKLIRDETIQLLKLGAFDLSK